MAEVACQTVGWRFATVEDREVITAMVADAAEQASLRLTPPELATSPAKFRRPDGTSVFRPKHSTVFSSDSLLAAEDHLLQRARTATGPTIDLTTVGTITSKADSEGRVLGPDQAAALASVASLMCRARVENSATSCSGTSVIAHDGFRSWPISRGSYVTPNVRVM